MKIELFDYYLPEELIAQSPSEVRDECRLLSINRENKTFVDEHFFDIKKYFKKGDVLVRNNTRVIPARLFGVKKETGAKVEVLLLKDLGNDTWECLCGNAKTIKIGTKIGFKDDILVGECVATFDEGIRHIKFSYKGIFLEELEKVGLMPLPPYIHSQCDDNEKYQTVYSKISGSAAAPTAGFHFTNELLDEIKNSGVTIVDITLNIGLGTFRPVKVDDTEKHTMHSEEYDLSEEAAKILNRAKKEGRRIIAVGTTSVRTLEANISKYGEFKATHESTNIFIQPGYEFKAVDALITNFHLPKSTLIMLVSAFMGREFTLECYNHAVKEKYRFFSFGDSMFIYGKPNKD
ncbi:MAG: tRNA preQ1(34) S-adenosylmethionine ribosyltransferase-isomerase QueA [Bacilli bacterium]|nr:tRNA preQ1(34) S-adenosylmethionine ribosyltransferase-isomerase QueA [Bacilli bacterium]